MSESEHPPAISANGVSQRPTLSVFERWRELATRSQSWIKKHGTRPQESSRHRASLGPCPHRAGWCWSKLKSLNRNIVFAKSIADLARREIEQARSLGLHPPSRLHGLKQTLLFSLT